MKLKEINRTAHISFSPSKLYPCYLASGTAAQQLDASFSTTSCLELHRLDLSNLNEELLIDASMQTESRFNKLLWNDYTNNLIIGGCENGSIYLYDFEKILANDQTSIVKLDKHSGIVGALDVNPLQTNLLASGAGASEILIWDLNNPTTPSMPGAKMLPLDDIQCVAWNHQVPHILASTSNGKCVVWDLRKNENIIKISDSTSKLRAKITAWHPDVATQLCLASEDDHSPQLQMWDLRFATAPVKLFNGHQRGVLTFAWSPSDSDLLVSCGKDNRILCWNPNTNSNNVETVLEIPSSQWCFDVSWCSRYPHLIATASYESILSVYSLMGGKYDIKPETSNKIMDSFGVSNSQSLMAQPAPIQTQIIPQLKLAPKWMKRPCGVSFGFGGRLVTFGVEPVVPPQTTDPHHVPKFQAQKISIVQVVTDTNLVEESQKLESALQTGQLIEFCNYKLQTVSNTADQEIWKFIMESFNKDKKFRFVDLLGFNATNLTEKVQDVIKLSNKNEEQLETKLNSQLNLSSSSTSTQSHQDSGTDKNESRSASPINLSFANKSDNLLCESLLLGQYELAVELCINEDRYTDAILIASFAGNDLYLRTRERYFKNSKNKFSQFLENYLNQDWNKIISNCNLKHWKEALAAVLTYTNGDQLYSLCNLLGNRLENDGHLIDACICYICSSNLDQLVECWLRVQEEQNKEKEFSAILQNLIEKIMILQFSLQNIHREHPKQTNSINRVLIQYSKLLAEQGCYLTALNYIKDSHDSSLTILKDRLFNTIGSSTAQKYGIAKPDNPFKTTQHTNVKSNIQAHSTHSRTPAINPTAQAKPQLVSKPASNIGTTSLSHPYPTPVQTLPPQNPNLYAPLGQTNTVPPALGSTFYNPPQPQPHVPLSNPIQTQPSHHPSFNNQNNRFISPPVNNTPVLPPQPTVPLNTAPPNLFVPTSQPAAPQQTSTTSAPLSYQEVRPATAWNDPPIVQQKIKAPVLPKDTGIEPSKIYQPTMQIPSTPQAFSNINNMHQNQSIINGASHMSHLNQQNNYFNPINTNNGLISGFNPAQANLADNRIPTPTTQQTVGNVRKTTMTPAVDKQPKLPIPSEYLGIQLAFDDLLKRCLDLSTQPAPKRKLEEVAKKLEILYDKLRDKTLSETVIQGLQTIIQYIQAHDYNSSLALHTHIVATSNFSEISAFMPGIKVLIQSCQQLNIVL